MIKHITDPNSQLILCERHINNDDNQPCQEQL